MKKESVNQFNGGLNFDLHPTVTPNSVLTDNLNGTFITYNGNEFCLQNDKGNFKVASLSKDYVPIGAKEYNGIIYIVSVKNEFKKDENGDYIIDEETNEKIIDSSECLTEIGTYPGIDWNPESSLKDGVYDKYEKEFYLDFNKYTPLGNINVNDTTNLGDDFTNLKLKYTTQTPVTIEIQPSYDGSVNLILTDGVNTVKMINSGFSVLPENKYKLIKRNQTEATNNYSVDRLDELNLIRTTDILTNIDLIGVQSGGQLKGGNYTLYIKFGDADYNKTDVVAESGIISIFKGTDCRPTTISGTVLDERTDKMIGIKVTGLNRTYSKIYIYYSREYSDTLGYRLTEYGMFKEPIDIKPDNDLADRDLEQTIWLTGYEQTEVINSEEIKIDYHTFDSARAEAQQQNMLFLGNLKIEETKTLYKTLEKIAENITPVAQQIKNDLGVVSYLYNNGIIPASSENSEYYSVNNIYKYVGYWPDEYYRFGIVFILKDGSTTPVFNLKNKGVVKVPKLTVLNERSIKPISFKFILPNIDNDYIKNNVLGYFYVRQKRIPITLCQGLRLGIDKRTHLPITWNGNTWLTQSFLSFNRDLYKDSTKHVKKSPDLPLTSELAWSNCVPMLEYVGESIFSNSYNNQLKFANKYIPYKINSYNFGNNVNYALLTLDPCVEASIRNILDGSEFRVSLEWNTETHFGNSSTPNIIRGEKIDNNGTVIQIREVFKNSANGPTTNANCVYIPSNTKVKEINGVAFSNIAGEASDITKYEFPSWALAMRYNGSKKGGDNVRYWNLDDNFNTVKERSIEDDETEELEKIGFNSGVNVNIVRGIFAPYVGTTADLNAQHGIYSISIANTIDTNNVLIREQDESPYFAITERVYLSKNKVNAYRGDCFTTTNSIRIIRNFIDPDVPVTGNIVQGNSWHWFYRGYYDNENNRPGSDDKGRAYGVPSENEVPPGRVNRADVNTVDLGYWVTYKCLSSYNLGLRSEDRFHEQEMSLIGSPRSFFPINGGSTATGNKMEESFLLNNGYSATVGEKTYNLLPDVPYFTSEFANRIIFSNVQVDNSFTNGYRVFQGLSYQDYDKQYGAIVKLVPWDNNLLVVMEHGIGVVGVNEQALMQTSTADTIHIYGHGVLSDHMQIISPDFGSKYEHSVIRTPIGVYGIDTDARKIWRITTQKGFETLSDMKIESYLNDEMGTNLPVQMELCDIRTHYNEAKGDIMFTFYKSKSKIRPNKKMTPTEEAVNIFSIDKSDVKMSMDKTITIPFSTTLPENKISIDETKFVSAEIDYANRLIKVTAPNQAGTGSITVNGNKINITVKSQAEEFADEQKEITDKTGTTTETVIDEETGEETVVVVPTLEIGVSGPMVTSKIYTSDRVDNKVYFSNNPNNVTLADCEVSVSGVNADIDIVGQHIYWTPRNSGTAIITVTYHDELSNQDVIAQSPEMTVLEGKMESSSDSIVIYEKHTGFITFYHYVGKLTVEPSKDTYASAYVTNDWVVFTGLKEGLTSFDVKDDAGTTITINVEVKGDIILDDINFYDYWHSTTPMDFPDSVTLHLENGTKYFYFRYNYSPLDYNPYTNDVVLDSKDNKDSSSSTRPVINYRDAREHGSEIPAFRIDPIREGSSVFTIKLRHLNPNTNKMDVTKTYTCNVTVVK